MNLPNLRTIKIASVAIFVLGFALMTGTMVATFDGDLSGPGGVESNASGSLLVLDDSDTEQTRLLAGENVSYVVIEGHENSPFHYNPGSDGKIVAEPEAEEVEYELVARDRNGSAIGSASIRYYRAEKDMPLPLEIGMYAFLVGSLGLIAAYAIDESLSGDDDGE